MASPIEWDFEPRNATFIVSVRATFHPLVGAATLSLPWLDASGALTAPVTLGPFNTLDPEPDTNPGDSGNIHGFQSLVRVRNEKELGVLPVSLALVQALVKAELPISVRFDGDAGDGTVTSSARVHLGPLLLAHELGHEAAQGGHCPKWPSCVSASLTETIGLAGLHRLELTIRTTEPILSEAMLERLLPACITIDSVQGLPCKPGIHKECEEVRLEICTPPWEKDEPKLVSICRPHDRVVRFAQPVVWLFGLAPLHEVRDWLQNGTLSIEIHDRDARAAETDGNNPHAEGTTKAIHPHGLAQIRLDALLKARRLSVALRGEVFPVRGNKKNLRAEAAALRTKELDPSGDVLLQAATSGITDDNTEDTADYMGAFKYSGPCTAPEPEPRSAKVFEPQREHPCRRRGQTVANKKLKPSSQRQQDSSDEDAPGAVCLCRAGIALPLPSAEEIQKEQEEAQRLQWINEEHRVGESNVWAAGSEEDETGPFRVKWMHPSTSEAVRGPWRRRLQHAQEDERLMLEALGSDEEQQDADAAVAKLEELSRDATKDGLDCRYERYGRVIVLVADNDKPTIQAVQKAVRDVNAKALDLHVSADAVGATLRTTQLSEHQQNDPHLDILTGFVVLDGHYWLFVIEGLRERGIPSLLEAIPTNDRKNSSQFKILHHPKVAFSKRLYAEFGPELKRVKVKTRLAPEPKPVKSKTRPAAENSDEGLATRADLYSLQGSMKKDILVGMESIKLLMDLRQIERMQCLRGHAVDFPRPEHVVNLEVLYGAYADDNELEGLPPEKNTRTSLRNNGSSAPRLSRASASAPTLGQHEVLQDLATITPPARSMSQADVLALAIQDTNRTPLPRKTQKERLKTVVSKCDTWQSKDLLGVTRRTGADIEKGNCDEVKKRSDENVEKNDLLGKTRTRDIPFLEGITVHPYSGQKLNSAELQKEWMRKKMDSEVNERTYTYASIYNSQALEFSGAESPGRKTHKPRCPTDTYARSETDTRPIFRPVHARPPEEFRKPETKVAFPRPEEFAAGHLVYGLRGDTWQPARVEKVLQDSRVLLRWKDGFKGDDVKDITDVRQMKDQYVEGEWYRLPVGDRKTGPFKASTKPDRTMESSNIQSTKLRSESAPEVGLDVFREAEDYNKRERELAASKILDRTNMRAPMRFFSEGGTRHGVTDLDRYEPTMKDTASFPLRGRVDGALPVTIRNHETYHDVGKPQLEWHARLRENDMSPPYEANTGAYLPRDPQAGTKRGCMSGTLYKAPWQHGASKETLAKSAVKYPSTKDFNNTKQAPKSRLCENQIHKNASRTSLSQEEKTGLPFRRPADYGAQIPS